MSLLAFRFKVRAGTTWVAIEDGVDDVRSAPGSFNILLALIVAVVTRGFDETAYRLPALVRFPETLRTGLVPKSKTAITPCGTTSLLRLRLAPWLRPMVPPIALPRSPRMIDWCPVLSTCRRATSSAGVSESDCLTVRVVPPT